MRCAAFVLSCFVGLASYNAGEGAVRKYKNTVPPYPETRNYVQIVSQFYQLYKSAGGSDTALASHSSDVRKRIHMTIPGRRSMPAPATQPE
jgi:hypothetical protein